MMKVAWDGYVKHAWGYDELRPISKTGWMWDEKTNCSMMYTPIDSLDTLFLMGLDEEFKQAKGLVLDEFKLDKYKNSVNVFETTIRTVGGLLSAYELDGDYRFIEQAVKVADTMLPAFDTPNGVPLNFVEVGEKRTHGYPGDPKAAFLSDAGSMQLEFQYLSDVTGNIKYAELVS